MGVLDDLADLWHGIPMGQGGARPVRPEGATRLESLEQDVSELRLVVLALMAHLDQKGVIRPEEFVQTLKPIDAADGVEDGRVTPQWARPYRLPRPAPPPAAPSPPKALPPEPSGPALNIEF